MTGVVSPLRIIRVLTVLLGFVVLLNWHSQSVSAGEKNSRWEDIKSELFEGRTIHDGASVINLVAPNRALNAAIVPIAVTTVGPQKADNPISRLYIIIDRNPVPLAGVITIHDLAAGWKKIATRVRVNEYSQLRIVAETTDARLFMVSKFIKASGGCSARPLNSQKVAMARIGQMTFDRSTIVKTGEALDVKFMMRHPNNSGLQFDQISRFFIPAHYINTMSFTFDGQPVLTIDADISISEDPTFEFSFTPGKAGKFKARIIDTNEIIYQQQWDVKPLFLG